METSSVLNYVKAVLTKEYAPVRAIIIRNFILKCQEKQLCLHTCELVYQEAKNYRALFRRELIANGFDLKEIERILQIAKVKLKKFIDKVKLSKALPETRYTDVKSFFDAFKNDKRLIELMQRKNNFSPLPEESDLKILAQALNFQNLYFVTTDEHFFVLEKEIEQHFNISIINDDNAHQRMRQWKWE